MGSVLRMSTLRQGHSEEGRLGQTEVTGLDAKVEDEDRGEEKWKRKQQVELYSKVEAQNNLGLFFKINTLPGSAKDIASPLSILFLDKLAKDLRIPIHFPL